MSEWLDVMLDEIRRKKLDQEEADAERQRRTGQNDDGTNAEKPVSRPDDQLK